MCAHGKFFNYRIWFRLIGTYYIQKIKQKCLIIKIDFGTLEAAIYKWFLLIKLFCIYSVNDSIIYFGYTSNFMSTELPKSHSLSPAAFGLIRVWSLSKLHLMALFHLYQNHFTCVWTHAMSNFEWWKKKPVASNETTYEWKEKRRGTESGNVQQLNKI